MPANLKNLTRSSAIAFATATALACATLSTASFAADDLYDPGVTEVEFGTGWYIRGDIGLTGHEIFRDGDTAEPIPGTNNLSSVVSDTDNVFGVGVGIGMRFTNNLRGDIGYSYMAESDVSRNATTTNYRPPCSNAFVQTLIPDPNDPLGGGQVTVLQPGHTITNCVEEADTSYFLQTLMANAYYDFDTSLKGFRPFVGIGAGVVRNQFEASTGNITCTPSSFELCNPTDGVGQPGLGESYTQEGSRVNGTSYHLAGSLTAGLAYALSDTLFLDTSYQYTHIAEDALWGGVDGIEAAGTPTNFHTFKVGLRMEIW